MDRNILWSMHYGDFQIGCATVQNKSEFFLSKVELPTFCSCGIHTRTLTFSISTQDGVSALYLAKQQNHPQVCEILEKHRAKETGPGSQVVMC